MTTAKPEPPHASKWQAFRIECERQTAAPRVDGRPQCEFPFCGCASYRFEGKRPLPLLQKL